MRLRILCVLAALLCAIAGVRAADADTNIVIQKATENYRFVYNSKQNRVEIKQEATTAYLCNSFRTSLTFVDMYDNETSIDDVSAVVDGKKLKTLSPTMEYYSVDGIFFSDTRVCYFDLPLAKQGSVSEVKIEKTITDPRYFTSVYFNEGYKILSKQITITVPRWMKAEFKQMNFAGFDIKPAATYDSKADADVYTYTCKNLPARVSERYSPGPSYIYPHLFVVTQSANPGNNSFAYFKSLKEQYGWYHSLVKNIDNDKAVLKAKADEITKGITGDMDKVKAIYYWVQNNIRYIAFEDGIAGFRPDKANEVLRKKYGDCKGMAHLTKELLASQGFDARLCWIGTNHIAYDYSSPNLSVDNHMICALNYKSNMYFLDATETYSALNDYAERIQGRQVLVEDGEKYILTNIPATTFAQNMDAEKRTVSIKGADIDGTATHQWVGEEKEYMISSLNNLKKNKTEEAFIKYLAESNKDYLLTDFVTSNIQDFDKPLTTSYKLTHKNAVSAFDKDLYVDLDFRKEFGSFIFDTAKRTNDYWFSYKTNMLRETELAIPAGYSVTAMPPNLAVTNNNYEFTITYTQKGDKLLYKKTIIIKNPRLPKTKFNQWNADIKKLNNSYNEQIVLTAK